MICCEKQIVFVHVPRTGGTSIENCLFKPQNERTVDDLWGLPNMYCSDHLQHLPLSIIHKIHDGKYSNWFSFAFVRNPFDRAVSTYHVYIKIKHHLIKDIHCFKDFIKNVYLEYDTLHHKPQIDMLTSHEDQTVDFIGKFENLQNDFNTICDQINITRTNLSHTNKSDHKHYSEYYDDETRKLITDHHIRDLEQYDYDFEFFK